jgi:hypothetical protein
MTEDNGAKTEGAKVPREELCPTCGRAWGDLTGCYCSNSWHLAAPMVRKQIASLQDELAAVREALKDIIKFCEQFELSESKIEALNEYKKLLSS